MDYSKPLNTSNNKNSRSILSNEEPLFESASKIEEVRDGHLADLPEDLRIKVMNVHKLIVTKAREIFKDKNYADIANSQWAQTMLEEFLTTPSPKTHAGVVRLYKKGKRYRCMIQITNHVDNDRSDIDHELFHDFIRNLHQRIKSRVRRKFDLTLTCESEHGETFEGFDLWTKQKEAKVLWELFEDKITKKLTPMEESSNNKTHGMLVVEFSELPRGIQSYINNSIDIINKEMGCINYVENYSGIYGTTELRRVSEEQTEGTILITDEIDHIFIKNHGNDLRKAANDCNLCNPDPTKKVIFNGSYYEAKLDGGYANLLFDYLEEHVNDEIYAGSIEESYEFNPYTESEEPLMQSGLSEQETRKTMRTLTKNIIESFAKNDGYKVSAYTLSIYSNLTSKNLLQKWGPGYHKFSLIINNDKTNTLKFITPNITKDFISRFIEGRETIDGLLHRNPEIKISISQSALATIKDPDDMYQFIKAAIKYYDIGVKKYSNQIMKSLMSMSREIKHLVSTTKLSGLVIAPLKMIFAFDNVDISNRKTFIISKSDIDAVTSFINSIYSNYASPEKEKNKIINDMNEIISSLHEAYGMDEDIRELKLFSESLSDLLDGNYDAAMNEYKNRAIEEEVDRTWNVGDNINYQIKYYQEKWGVKKLKKLPRDLVAYISIETEAIRDYNDKAMIASYCISKIDICEWYIELLEVGSKKYIVPHSLPYLKNLRTELLQCYERIMKVKIDDKNKEVTIPPGYEG